MRRFFLFLLLLLAFTSLKAQFSRIIIDDQAKLVNEVSQNYLLQKLASKGVVLDDYLDYEKRCQYLFISISQKENGYEITSRDCQKNQLKDAFLDSDIKLASDESIGNAIGNIVLGMMNQEGQPQVTPKGKMNPYTNHHDSRYFFAPTAYNLKKGQLYYNTLYFAAHEVQYGVTDNLSLGLGTTVGFFPAYVSPKFSKKIGPNAALMVGDLFVFGTYASNFVLNLAYGGITLGNTNNNITLAGGILNSNSFSRTIAVGNVSAMASLSKYIYFVTENYVTQLQYNVDGFRYINGGYQYLSVEASRNIIGGFSGVRVISKRKDVQSVQFGFVYFIPLSQQSAFNNPTGNIPFSTEPRFGNSLVIPGISYTLKFGKVF